MAISLMQKRNLKNLTIYSGSKSTIKAIISFNPKKPIAFKIRFLLHSLRYKQISLCWIPSHIGVRGNEEPDKAAEQAFQ